MLFRHHQVPQSGFARNPDQALNNFGAEHPSQVRCFLDAEGMRGVREKLRLQRHQFVAHDALGQIDDLANIGR